MIKCKVLQDFQMAGKMFKKDEIIEIPDDSVIRLRELLTPVEVAHLETITEKPPVDKAVKKNKILKKGVSKK